MTKEYNDKTSANVELVSEVEYTATLKLTSKGADESVQFELVFDPPRGDDGSFDPTAYQVMDFINETSVLPFAAIAAQLETNTLEAPQSVN